jgi:glucokinase
MLELALGVDIGGTNIEFGLVDRKGNLLYNISKPTNSFPSAEDFIQFIKEDSTIQSHYKSIKGIGIGAPNGNYYSGTIDFAPNLHWEGIIPLRQISQSILQLPTILTNDANAAAVGEKIFGVAKDLSDFVTITLGTGLGSGIFCNNQIVYGAHGIAGEYGHVRVIPNGRSCKCGRFGCLESYASSTGIVRSYYELESPNKHLSLLNELPSISAKDIFEYAEKKDPYALELVNYTAEILGSALADFACFSDPKAYILFGGIAQNGDFFKEKVAAIMNDQLILPLKNKIEVRVSALHKTNAAILGNAAMVFHEIK